MNKKIFAILLLALVLRTVSLNINHPGFYSDETSYSYNAYSILKSGRDEYGRFLPWYFEAFSDYKLPVTTYTIVVSFALFGASDITARIPTALYGVLAVYATYLLTKQIVQLNSEANRSSLKYLPFVSALILAITPSHIFMSRGLWDIQPALALLTLGVFFYLKAINSLSTTTPLKILVLFLSSAICFVLSTYAYNSARVVAPLVILILTIGFSKQFFEYFVQDKARKLTHKIASIIIPSLIALIILWPQIQSLSQPAVTQRAKYVSVFHHGLVPALLNEAYIINQGKPVWQTRLVHNRYNYYAREIFKNYATHFTPQFLFLTGDTHEIFRTTRTGFLLPVMAPFLLLGATFLLIKRPKGWWIIGSWLVIAPIPSALTIFVPSVSRALNMVIPFSIITAYGLVESYCYITKKYQNKTIKLAFNGTISALILTNMIYWSYQYFIETPKDVAHIWESGFKELVEYVEINRGNYDKVLVSNAQAPSYIWFAWYGKLEPSIVWKTRVTDFKPDSNGLNTTSALNGIIFTKNIKKDCDIARQKEKTLCVGFANEIEGEHTIYASNGRPKFSVKQ